MNTPFELIKSTESLLSQSRENLTALRTCALDKNEKSRLVRLTSTLISSQKEILRRKTSLLELLCRLGIKLGIKRLVVKSVHNQSPVEFQVELYRYADGSCRLGWTSPVSRVSGGINCEYAVKQGDFPFNETCRALIEQINNEVVKRNTTNTGDCRLLKELHLAIKGLK